MSNSKNCLEFFKQVSKLKHLERTGWVMKGIPHPETMCLVHDLAECEVGDITPHCGVSDEDKHKREMSTMSSLTSLLNPPVGSEMFNLLKEYEAQNTPESHLVKDLDKFDMILQAFEYEVSNNKPGWLEEFFLSTEGKFRHPRVMSWVAELKQQRLEFLKSNDPVQSASNSELKVSEK
ncbi:5'-deoxynucleotidase HDDC2 isoform X2 [Hyalella azteca]|uniref:5'-deoxynucleotidase HDDC2 isoform X2 n=1 Tax=Hyalella azteca TaxID=294128 RepID=A0A8B7NXW5_HYAAZ|nr:5'-deoxynucleotidase HDDC2 isoform X2 [Hyalella azteca]